MEGDMRKGIAIAAASMLVPAGAAQAAFLGWEAQWITLGNGHLIGNVYAMFSNSNDRVLALYDTHIISNQPFHQSAANPFWMPASNQNKHTSDDSWVALGTNPSGSGNVGTNGIVQGDSDFVNFTDSQGATDFSYIQNSGGGAGWFNANPSNGYGYAFETFNGTYGQPIIRSVLLAHFVLTDYGGPPFLNIFWQGSLAVQFAGDSEVTYGVGADMPKHIMPLPGPSVLSLGLGAGMAFRRPRSRVR